MQPLVSIIIPTFNRAHTLGRAIESVKNQTYTNWECVVVDDFSEDESKKIIQELSFEDKRITYFPNRVKGANSARNYGLQKSKGDYVLFLDSDDAFESKMLEESLYKAKVACNIDLIVSQTKIFRGEVLEGVSDKVNSDDLLLDFFKKKVTWPLNSVLIHKQLLLTNNIIFHSKLLNGQDYCFFLSLLVQKPNIVFTDKPLAINYHLRNEPEGVKISAGDSLKFKLSRMRSRNIAFLIALKNLPFTKFLSFLPYFAKHQLGLISDILKTKFG